MREQELAAGWARELATVAARIGTFVTHPAPRARVGRFLDGTLAGGGRRNGWQLAEAAHEATPYGMQRLVARCGMWRGCETICARTCRRRWGTAPAC